MAEFLRRLRSLPQRSIFLKLFLIFLFTAFVLVIIIRGFFLLTLDRNQSFKADLFRNLTKYSEQLVADIGHPPSQEVANRLAQELGTQFRVKTAEEQWSTDQSLPAFSELHVDESFSTPGTLVGASTAGILLSF